MASALLEQLINGLMMGSIYVLVGLGLVLIYGVMHVLNFAHGMLFMLGGYMTYTFFAYVTDSYAIAVLLAMLSLMAFGYLLEQGVFKPLRGNLRNQVIASLALVLLIQNSVVAIWGPTALQFKLSTTEVFVPLGALRFSLQHILIIVVTFLFMGVLFAFLKYTKFGTALRATSQDNDAAMVVGINVQRMYWVSFAIGSGLAALGGALIGPLFLVFPQMGDLPLLKALAAILLGGMGSIPGAVVGGLLIGVTEAFATIDTTPIFGFNLIGTDYRDAVTFVVIILILLFRPQGLFGVRVRGKPEMRTLLGDRFGLWGTLAIGLILFLIPTVFSDDPYLLHISILICIYAIPAVGLNLMLGYTGLVSLGHMAFAGIGAYVAAVLMVDADWSFWVATPVAVATAGVMGALIGIPALRLKTHYFIIVTLAFGMILFLVMNNWEDVTRGAEGFPGIPRPAPLPFGGPEGFTFFGLDHFFYLVLAFTVLVFVIQWALVRSDFGRTLEAIKQDETLTAFKGVNTMAYKVAVFAIGSAIAGLGGVLKVSFLRVAAPLSFELLESINIVLIVVVGGAGFLIGPLLGSILFVGLPEYLRIAKELRLVIFGAILLVITLFAPKGLAGLPGLVRAAFKRRRDAAL